MFGNIMRASVRREVGRRVCCDFILSVQKAPSFRNFLCTKCVCVKTPASLITEFASQETLKMYVYT